jgi:hypothetical protein
METNRKLTVLRLLVLGVLVAGFNAKPASAQIVRGKFTLPFTARWNLATLPAGDYSFTLDNSSADGKVTVYRGTRSVAMILTEAINYSTSDRSEMVLEDGAVRELRLPEIGLTFDYPTHNPRHQAAPEESQVAHIIPVAVASTGR